MKSYIINTLKKCVEKAIEHELPELPMESSLADDLKMDSVQIVTLQIELEDAFQIEFDPLLDDFYCIFETISSLYSALERKLYE